MKLLLVNCCLLMALLSPAGAAALSAEYDLEPSFEELLFADLIVEGKIGQIREIMIPHDDFLPGLKIPHDIHFAEIYLEVANVLLGDSHEEILMFNVLITYSDRSHFNLNENDRVIAALKYKTLGKGYFSVGRYLLRNDLNKFFLEGTEYLQGDRENPLGAGEVTALYEVIETVNYLRSFEYLASRADLIIRGDILDTWAASEAYGKGEATFSYAKIGVEKWLKGKLDADEVVIKTISKAIDWPKWQARMPSTISKGEHWFMFLKWYDEIGCYHPFAGVNGMFRIDEEKVVKLNHNYLDTGYTPEGFESKIEHILESQRSN